MRPDPSLYNPDLAPIPLDSRTWGMYSYLSLWVAMSVCIPTYMLASGLIAGGMNWWEAIGTILLGNLLVLIPMLLNAHAGAKYGIPFPVLVRASFGVKGANIPAVLRALVACGWFGIQSWIGGQAIYSMFRILWPAAAVPWAVWACFGAFWLLNMLVIWRGIETIRFLEGIGAPFMLGIGLLLLVWITGKAGGLGPVLSAPSKFKSRAEFFRFFVPSLTAMVGFWATVALNIPDFTRYSKSQRAQMVGQAIGLPTAMTLYSFIGVAVTSASVVLFGQGDLGPGGADRPLPSAAGGLHRADRHSDRDPQYQRRCQRCLAFQRFFQFESAPDFLPHRRNDHWSRRSDDDAVEAVGHFSSYIFGWLVGYSGLLGPIAGVMIADYFIVRKRTLNVDDFYCRGGLYEYSGGFNPRALLSLAAGHRHGAAGPCRPAAALALRLCLVRWIRRLWRDLCAEREDTSRARTRSRLWRGAERLAAGPRLAEQLPPLSQHEALVEANRCLYCYDAPCTQACPTHIDVPALHQENLHRQSRRLRPSHLRIEPPRRNLLASLSRPGAMRRRVRSRLPAHAHHDRPAAALRDGLRLREPSNA